MSHASSVGGNVQKSSSSKAAAILTSGAYSQYVSTAKGRERRWRLFSTFPYLVTLSRLYQSHPTPTWFVRSCISELLGQHQKCRGYQMSRPTWAMSSRHLMTEAIRHRSWGATPFSTACGRANDGRWQTRSWWHRSSLAHSPLPPSSIAGGLLQRGSSGPAGQSAKDPNKGPKQGLLPRTVALYRCQQLGGYRLADIMCPFGLSTSGSVSFITTQIRKQRKENKECVQTLQQVKGYILKHAY